MHVTLYCWLSWMKYLIVFASILSFVFAQISCTSNQTFVKFIKKSSYFANEESFQVYDGDTLLYTSPPFAANTERPIEECLTSSMNNQYTVVMIDGYGDSWSSGSWLAIYGQFGNLVFKSMLIGNRETHPFSLYYGIEEYSEWKFTSESVSSGWVDYSFDDIDWDIEILGSMNVTTFGTQYFRKQFTGLSNMAAYDVRLYYKAGIIAYINGKEVYRDNMAIGDVNSTTLANNEHDVLAYRGFIRPGSEVSNSQSILAVELHFLSYEIEIPVNFNAYLAILAPSALNTDCFIYGDSVSITANPSTGTPSNVFDFSRFTSFSISSSYLPNTITYSFEGPRPFINSIRVWPHGSPTTAPGTFTFQGSHDGDIWTTIVNVRDATNKSSTYQLFDGYYFGASLYNNYRAVITSASSTNDVYVYEMQPLICSTAVPTSITYTPNNFTFYAFYDVVSIKPDIDEFTSCTAQNLPEGLSIDFTTCEISGHVMNVMSNVNVIVSSIVHGTTYTGSFTISFIECTGTMINVLRTYKSDAYRESFDIKDASTEDVIISVATNSGQVNNKDWIRIACVTGSKYVVSVASTLNYWQYASHLYIRAMFSVNEMETILRMNYDNYLGFPNTRTFNAAFAVKPHSQWYYKYDEVPENWYSSSIEGWSEGNDSTFLSSTNQIQIYKTTFSVSDISNVAGVVLSIKYKYGIVVYMNGNESFRNGVTGSVSTSSYGSNIYSDVMYRQISLPLKTVQVGEISSVNFVQQGTNTIAIALVATNSQQTEFNFDCAVRLMGEAYESRVFDYSVSYSSIYGNPTNVFNHYYGYNIFYPCNDRREWVNSVVIKLHYTQNTRQPRQFTLKARNAGEDWTTLSTVTDLTWSQTGQAHTIYFQNNKAYNEYRFENFGTGDFSDCYWQLNTLDLRSVMTIMTVPELSYGDSITIFKDIEMGEEYPNSEYYYGFTITPNLPVGIHLDPNTGMISGTATAESGETQYSVTANKLTGGNSTATFTLGIGICTGGRSLVTLVARIDSYPEQASYKLYQGIGTSGTVVDQISRFQISSGLNYADFCMNDGIYTLQLLDSSSNGWYNPAGYYLTVDLGEMIFEMGQVPSGVPSVSTVFSTYFPFQINYSDWKMSKEFVQGWNTVDYNDSAWSSVKAANIGTNTEITTYLRHDVNIPDINNYHVLNIRVKYVGGVAAYFNGRLVARFNLEENFNSETRSIDIHDANVFSKFHVIMSTVGAVTGKNVIGFEIHRPMNNSLIDVIFDATGVFGVNDCSIVVDTYSEIDGTNPTSGTLEQFLDLNPTTYGYQPNAVGTYLAWTVENLEGAKFNSFAMQTPNAHYSYGFSLYVRNAIEYEYTPAVGVINQRTLALQRNAWSAPLGIAGSRQMRFEVDDTASSAVYVSSYILQYCKLSGGGIITCTAIDGYPSVGDGEISTSTCEYGYRGYTYRLCQNGTFGEIYTDRCVLEVPSGIQYSSDVYNLVLNTNVHIPAPTYANIIEHFYLAENINLPTGLTLNNQTGEITGIPTQEWPLSVFTIYGSNQVGVTFVVLNIMVQRESCRAEGLFPTTFVGEFAVYDCASGGDYIGILSRACLLGVSDGEWQEIEGVCMPLQTPVLSPNAFDCQNGYDEYRNYYYFMKEDGNITSEMMGAFNEYCETIKRKSLYGNIQVEYTILADFPANVINRLQEQPRIVYSRVGSETIGIPCNNEEYHSSLNGMDRVFSDDLSLRYSSPYGEYSGCSVSWAITVVKAAENSLKMNGLDVKLSWRYLVECLPQYYLEENENVCDGVHSKEIIEFIRERGLIAENDEVTGDICNISGVQTYKFQVYESDGPNKYGLMNLVNEGYPTVVLMAIDIDKLKFVRDMRNTTDVLRCAGSDPSLYGMVVGYKNSVGEVDGYWEIESNVVPFENIFIRIPLTSNETSANYAGIAAYPFSLHYSPDVLTSDQSNSY